MRTRTNRLMSDRQSSYQRHSYELDSGTFFRKPISNTFNSAKNNNLEDCKTKKIVILHTQTAS